MVNLENIKDIESAKNEEYNGRDLTEKEKKIFDYLRDYLCDYLKKKEEEPWSYLKEVKQVAEYLDLVIWSEHNEKVEKEGWKSSWEKHKKLTDLVINESESLESSYRSPLFFVIKAINTNDKQFGKAFEKEIDKWKKFFEKNFAMIKEEVETLEDDRPLKKYLTQLMQGKSLAGDVKNSMESKEVSLYRRIKNNYCFKKQVEKSEKVIKSPRKIHQESFPTIEEGQQIEELISDWSDISPQFKNNPNLVKSWTEKGFNKLQTKKWNDIGLKPTESEFAQFLRDIKRIMSTKEILNEGSVKELKEEFQEYKKLHTKIETPLEWYELQR